MGYLGIKTKYEIYTSGIKAILLATKDDFFQIISRKLSTAMHHTT